MYRILTVDYNKLIRMELTNMHSLSDDFEITAEASNRHEAIKFLKHHDYDLVIIDISSQMEEGIMLLLEIKEQNLCPYVVLIADKIQKEFAQAALRYGVIDILIKPICEKKVLNLLNNVKDYITKSQESKVNMDDIFKNNIQFPNYLIDSLVDDILNKNENTIKNAKYLADFIVKKYNNENVECSLVLSGMANYILEKVRLKHPWIDMYLSDDELKNSNSLCDIDSSKSFFVSLVKILYEKIKLLFLCNDDDVLILSIVTMILMESDSNLSLSSISDKLYMNKTYVSEIFKKKTGILLREYIRRVKIERAKVLILTGQLKTFEIANKLGYKDVEYFSKTFKKYTGATPSEYKNYKIDT